MEVPYAMALHVVAAYDFHHHAVAVIYHDGSSSTTFAEREGGCVAKSALRSI